MADLTFRSNLDRPLTIVEADANITELAARADAAGNSVDIVKDVTITDTDTKDTTLVKINALPAYTVEAGQNVWFRCSSSTKIVLYKMFNKGKGNYGTGTGRIQLTINDIELINQPSEGMSADTLAFITRLKSGVPVTYGLSLTNTEFVQASTNTCPIVPDLTMQGVRTAGHITSATIETRVASGTVAIVLFRNNGSGMYVEFARQNFSTTIGIRTYDLSAYTLPVLVGDFIGFYRVNDAIRFGVKTVTNYVSPVPTQTGGVFSFTVPAADNRAYNFSVGISSGIGVQQDVEAIKTNLTTLNLLNDKIYGAYGDTVTYGRTSNQVDNASIVTYPSLCLTTTTFTGINDRALLKSITIGILNSVGDFNVILYRAVSGLYKEYRRILLTASSIANLTFDMTSYNAVLERGDIIGFANVAANLRFGIKTGATTYYTPVGTLVDGVYQFRFPSSVNNILLNATATVQEYSLSGKVIDNTTKISLMSSDIETLKAGGAVSQTSQSNTWLFRDPFAAISSQYDNTGWAVVPGGVSPATAGMANALILKRPYALNKRKYAVKFNLTAVTRLAVFNRMDATDNPPTTPSNAMFELNAVNNTVVLYDGNSNGTTLNAVLQTYPFTFVAGRDYVFVLRINKDAFSYTLTIIDTVTATSTDVFTDVSPVRRWNDFIGFATLEGTGAIIKYLDISTSIKKGARMLIHGDSITEAQTDPLVPGEGYAYKLINLLNGNGGVSGRSSGRGVGVYNRLITETAFIRPVYQMITIGTNDDDTGVSTWIPQIVTYLKSINVIPILNNITRRNTSVVNKNATIAAQRTANNLDGALFDVATSSNNNPAQSQNTTIYITGDTTHPNAVGHNEMFKRFAVDLPDYLD